MKLILASASPRRKELLAKTGMKFDIIPAKGEEIITKSIPAEGGRNCGAADGGLYRHRRRYHRC